MTDKQQQGKPQAQGREQTFEDYMRNARDAFVIAIKNEERSNYLLTAIDSFLICFDQMREKLTSSIPTEVQKEEWISCSERLPVGKKAAINTYIGLPGHITVEKDHVIFDDVHGDRFVYKYHDPAIYNNIYWLDISAPPISHKEDDFKKSIEGNYIFNREEWRATYAGDILLVHKKSANKKDEK